MDKLDDGTGETIAPRLTRADVRVEDKHNTCAREYALLLGFRGFIRPSTCNDFRGQGHAVQRK